MCAWKGEGVCMTGGGSCGGGGHVWQGDMHGQGEACVAGEVMCGRGVCAW